MPRIRHRSDPRSSGFTQVPNWLIRDATLTPNAKAVLVLLLSHADGWDTDDVAVGRELGMGRDAVRTAVKLLQDRALVMKTPTRTEHNAITGWEWIVSVPSIDLAGSDGATFLESHTLAQPEGGSGHPHKKTNHKKTTSKNETPLPPEGQSADDLIEFEPEGPDRSSPPASAKQVRFLRSLHRQVDAVNPHGFGGQLVPPSFDGWTKAQADIAIREARAVLAERRAAS